MTNDDLKKITKTMDDNFRLLLAELARVKTELSDSKVTQFRHYTELSKIGKDINRIDSVLETISDDQKHQTKLLNTLWDQVVVVTTDLTDVKETLDSHTDLLKAAAKTEQNSDNIQKLNKRVTTVEERAGISTPPELTIAP